MTVDRLYADRIYVLFEFSGVTYERLTTLGCRFAYLALFHGHQFMFRVVGPLVILQSHVYRYKFPTRTTATWSQSLCGQVITAMGVNQDELVG